jgi:hypothetical protein
MILKAVSIILAIAGGVIVFIDKENQDTLFWMGLILLTIGIIGILLFFN